MIFGTADFSHAFPPTGDPGAEAALTGGGYLAQQWAGLRRFGRALRPHGV